MAVAKLTATTLCNELLNTRPQDGGPIGKRPEASAKSLAEWVIAEVTRRAPGAPSSAFNEACRCLAGYEYNLQFLDVSQRSEGMAGQDVTTHFRPNASSWTQSGAANKVRAYASLRAGLI